MAAKWWFFFFFELSYPFCSHHLASYCKDEHCLSPRQWFDDFFYSVNCIFPLAIHLGSSRCSSAGCNPDSIHEVWSLPSLSGLRIWSCHELWCRSQMRLRSCVTVAVVWAGSCSSDLTPSLGTSICHRCGPEKKKKKLYWPSFYFARLWDGYTIIYLTDPHWWAFDWLPTQGFYRKCCSGQSWTARHCSKSRRPGAQEAWLGQTTQS